VTLFLNRQNWVGRIDPHDSHFLAIAIAEQQMLQAEFDDCIPSNSSGVTFCRSIALIVGQMRPFFTIVSHLFWRMESNISFTAVDVPFACAPCNRHREGC
jgi:hypothetical protein